MPVGMSQEEIDSILNNVELMEDIENSESTPSILKKNDCSCDGCKTMIIPNYKNISKINYMKRKNNLYGFLIAKVEFDNKEIMYYSKKVKLVGISDYKYAKWTVIKNTLIATFLTKCNIFNIDSKVSLRGCNENLTTV